MLFSSMLFLWAFLPCVFVLYRLIPGQKAKNVLLLLASLFFYAWGEPVYILLMLLSILMNYGLGIAMNAARAVWKRRALLAAALASNLYLLGYFKYSNFLAQTLGALAGIEITSFQDIILPIGISFYTFQSLSYVVDLYWRKIRVQRNVLKLGLYISFFPQLIAGPIVKYSDIADQIDDRKITPEGTAYGIRRFIFGLSKKVLIANPLGFVVDSILAAAPAAELSGKLLWVSAVCYALQIYFDFSGYSDMAIGLGRMFGFRIPENFNYPYTSLSVREFWRRWHISLSSWFRDYVYIPLGGSRRGSARTYLNLFIVFCLTGLWHGASWNFVLWGVYYGIFLILERAFLGKWLERCPVKAVNLIYTLLVVLIGWVLFRIETVSGALAAIRNMFTMAGTGQLSVWQFVSPKTVALAAAGILLSGIVQKNRKLREALYDDSHTCVPEIILLSGLFVVCVFSLTSATYNPFIYFRF